MTCWSGSYRSVKKKKKSLSFISCLTYRLLASLVLQDGEEADSSLTQPGRQTPDCSHSCTRKTALVLARLLCATQSNFLMLLWRALHSWCLLTHKNDTAIWDKSYRVMCWMWEGCSCPHWNIAAANILALVKITVLLHSPMTTFGQDFILDLIKKSFFPQEKILQNCQDFCFLYLLLEILQRFWRL